MKNVLELKGTLSPKYVFSYMKDITFLSIINKEKILFSLPFSSKIANWYERAVFQQSAFGSSTAGNDIVATIFIILFFCLFPVFSPLTFSYRRSVRIQKLILRKLAGAPKNIGVGTFPDPVRHLGPLAAILDLPGGAALQAVSECPLRR